MTINTGSYWKHKKTKRVAVVLGIGSGVGKCVAYRYSKPVRSRGRGQLRKHVVMTYMNAERFAKAFEQVDPTGGGDLNYSVGYK